MSNLDVRFTHIESPTLIALLFGALAGVAVLVYLRSLRGRLSALPALLVALRALSLSVALVLLLRPVVSFDRILRSDGRIAVLLDRSGSMATRDSVEGESRIDSAVRIASGEALERLRDLFGVEMYTFSAEGTLERWGPGAPAERPATEPREPSGSPSGADSADVVADGSSTDLASAWRDLPPAAAPLEAIVLLSDGRDHGRELSADGELPPEALPSYPVHVVGVGSGGLEARDLSWARVSSEQRALRGNLLRMEGTARLRGIPRARGDLVVRLDGAEVLRKELSLQEGLNDVTWEVRPDRGGSLLYEVALEPAGGDAIPENDLKHVSVEVSERQLQVLCFEGRARWQYKFLRRALERDPSVNVASLVHLGEGRRLAQGQAPADLGDGLPRAREEWAAFNVLVLGNVVSEELAPGDLARIAAWVSDDGGGLVLSGGPESLRSLAASALGEILPVTAGDGERVEGDLHVDLPLEALDHPISRGLGAFFASARRGGPFTLPEGFDAGRLRPGAELVLSMSREVPSTEGAGPGRDAEPEPRRHLALLAARQHGKGRILLWATESDWSWVLERSADGGDRLFATLWGRMVRWAAHRDDLDRGGPSIRLSPSVARAGEEVEIEVEYAGIPSRVAVSVLGPAGSRLPVLPDLTQDSGGAETVEAGAAPLTWKGRFRPRDAGIHSVAASLPAGVPRGPGGETDLGPSTIEAVLIVEPDTRELEDVAPDWDLLRGIAEGTGGRFLTVAEVGTLADGIVRHSRGSVTRVELGVDQSWPLFGLLVLLLTVEWLLRRRVHVI